MRGRVSTRGFTLLEMLLASALIVFIGMAVYKTFSNGMVIYHWLERNKPQNDAVIFFDKIAGDLRNGSVIPEEKFEGTPDRMAFYAHNTGYLTLPADRMPSAEGRDEPPLYKVEYVFERAGARIVRSVYRFGSVEPAAITTVMSGVGEMAFRYCVPDPYSPDKLEFRPVADRLPVAVEIETYTYGRDSRPMFFRRVVEVPAGGL
jgi:prepilin-type N-terminal cleavage/methylation domain-containing protein